LSIEYILGNSTDSILISEERDRKDVVIAVPHHAPLGVHQLPSPEHPWSDENAGLLGYHIAEYLNCSRVIACNYFHDSNKLTDTDYFRIIKRWDPECLIEIHGHRGGKAKFDIEISSGIQERSSWSERLAGRLKTAFAGIEQLRDYTISGEFDKIHFKATRSATITVDHWLPFHIELPLSIRSETSQYSRFCRLLAEIVPDLMDDF